MKLPKKIWIYWAQGFAQAPDLVKACVNSWQRCNPGWEVVLLHGENLGEFLDLSALPDPGRADLTVQHFSDIVRVNLLAKYGGVWADASCKCRKPLDAWLDDYMSAGFFVFRNHRRDRILSNWFLAAVPGSHLFELFADAYNRFWQEHSFSNQNTPLGRFVLRILRKRLNRNMRRTRWWLHPLFTRVLKVYPYPVFHYFFEKMVFSDEGARQLWLDAPPFPGDAPRIAKKLGLLNPATSELIEKLKAVDAPLYKLDWRLPYRDGDDDTLLARVLSDPTL